MELPRNTQRPGAVRVAVDPHVQSDRSFRPANPAHFWLPLSILFGGIVSFFAFSVLGDELDEVLQSVSVGLCAGVATYSVRFASAPKLRHVLLPFAVGVGLTPLVYAIAEWTAANGGATNDHGPTPFDHLTGSIIVAILAAPPFALLGVVLGLLVAAPALTLARGVDWARGPFHDSLGLSISTAVGGVTLLCSVVSLLIGADEGARAFIVVTSLLTLCLGAGFLWRIIRRARWTRRVVTTKNSGWEVRQSGPQDEVNSAPFWPAQGEAMLGWLQRSQLGPYRETPRPLVRLSQGGVLAGSPKVAAVALVLFSMTAIGISLLATSPYEVL